MISVPDRAAAARRGLLGAALLAGAALLMALGLLVLEPGPARAAAAPAPPAEVYDAVRVVERALTHHLGVRAAQLQYWLAQARAEEQRAALRPALSVSGGPYRLWREGTSPSGAVALPRPPDGYKDLLPWLGDVFQRLQEQPEITANGYRVTLTARASLWRSPLQQALAQLADANSAQAVADFENALGGAIVQSLEAYYGVLRAEAALRAAQAALREAENRVAEQAERLAAGTATQADLLQAEAQLYRAQAEAVRAEGELRAARMGLNQSLGYPLTTVLAVAETEIPAVWPSLEEALDLAQQRGDVQRARRDLERARASDVLAQEQSKPTVALVGRYRWPDVELSVSVDRHGYLGGTVMNTRQVSDRGQAIPSETPNWMVGLEVEWPLLDGGQRQAQRAQAALQVELAALQVEQLEQAVQAEVTAAYARLMAAEAGLRSAEQGVEAARQGLAIAQQLRAAGAATDGDVLRAETAVAQAELGRLEASYALTLAQAAYLQAAGVLVPHWLSLVGMEHLQLDLNSVLP